MRTLKYLRFLSISAMICFISSGVGLFPSICIIVSSSFRQITPFLFLSKASNVSLHSAPFQINRKKNNKNIVKWGLFHFRIFLENNTIGKNIWKQWQATNIFKLNLKKMERNFFVQCSWVFQRTPLLVCTPSGNFKICKWKEEFIFGGSVHHSVNSWKFHPYVVESFIGPLWSWEKRILTSYLYFVISLQQKIT